MRALDVEDKSARVYNYHRLTVREAVQIMASMGVTDPSQLNTRMLRRRVDHLSTRSYASIYRWIRQNELLNAPPGGWDIDWEEADADHFGEHAPIQYLNDHNPEWRSELLVTPTQRAQANAAERRASAAAQEAHPSTSPMPRVTQLADGQSLYDYYGNGVTGQRAVEDSRSTSAAGGSTAAQQAPVRDETAEHPHDDEHTEAYAAGPSQDDHGHRRIEEGDEDTSHGTTETVEGGDRPEGRA